MKAVEYARNVVDGHVEAPKYVKMQCKIFLKIANGEDKNCFIDKSKLEPIENALQMLIMPRGLKAGENSDYFGEREI